VEVKGGGPDRPRHGGLRRFLRGEYIAPLVLALILIGRYFAAQAGLAWWARADLYIRANVDLEEGRLVAALEQFRELTRLEPEIEDFHRQLNQTLKQALTAVPGQGNAAAEDGLLHFLAAQRDWEKFAEAADRSMAPIPAGEFLMGSPEGSSDEQPQVSVYLDAFSIDRFEVTNAQYLRFVQATGAAPLRAWQGDSFAESQGDLPAAGVSWLDAQAYCTWAGKRLPTEAEWEKACRGTDGLIYPWGNEWDASLANIDQTAGAAVRGGQDGLVIDEGWRLLEAPAAGSPRLQPVGSYLTGASPYGMLDMAGNVSEWVADYYNWAGYAGLPRRDPLVLSPPWNHVFRGSAWFDPVGNAGWVRLQSRCAARNSAHIDVDPRIGFRCASSLQATIASPVQ
jgi:sulfatase modifying factor 1